MAADGGKVEVELEESKLADGAAAATSVAAAAAAADGGAAAGEAAEDKWASILRGMPPASACTARSAAALAREAIQEQLDTRIGVTEEARELLASIANEVIARLALLAAESTEQRKRSIITCEDVSLSMPKLGLSSLEEGVRKRMRAAEEREDARKRRRQQRNKA